jgi:DNA-nicking Smr family endonuclease
MASRKKKPIRRTPEEACVPETVPFNNPFSATLRDLRRKVRERAAAAATSTPLDPRVRAGAIAAQPSKRDEQKARARADSVAVPRPSDDEEFRAAAAGAVPIGATERRVRKPVRASVAVARQNDAPTDFTADEHFDVRFSDRYIRASADGVSRETLAKLERGEFAVRSHVDLHGMALEDARRAVDDFLFERQRNGDRCVLVITGKGRNSRHAVGVLRERIPEWLARGPSARRVLAFVTARPCDGGEGALYVLLRKRTSSKARIDIVAGGGT